MEMEFTFRRAGHAGVHRLHFRAESGDVEVDWTGKSHDAFQAFALLPNVARLLTSVGRSVDCPQIRRAISVSVPGARRDLGDHRLDEGIPICQTLSMIAPNVRRHV